MIRSTVIERWISEGRSWMNVIRNGRNSMSEVSADYFGAHSFQQIAACNAWRWWWDIDAGDGEGVKWKVEFVSRWNSWFQVQLQGGLYDINDATRGDETHSIQWPLWDDVSNDEHRVWVKPTSVISFAFGLVEPWILNLVNRSRIRCLSPQFEGTEFIG